MNFFIETCSKVLNEISAGKINFDAHLERLKNSVTQKINVADNLIVCGLTPVGKKCLAGIKRHTNSDIFVFDIRNSSAPPRPGILNI